MKKTSYIPIIAVMLTAVLAGAAFAANGVAIINPSMAGVQAIGSTVIGTTYSTNDLIPLTVSEAWQLSNQNSSNFSIMIQQLAELSARNRGINFADSIGAGREIGQLVMQSIQANPNQLLSEAVDNSVKYYAASHPIPAGAGAGPRMISYSANQLMPLTVAQAWDLSGHNYDQMAAMVKTLAEVSADKRGVDIPDTITAGTDLGKLIKQKAEADPNQLLYVVVDSSVRDYAAMPR